MYPTLPVAEPHADCELDEKWEPMDQRGPDDKLQPNFPCKEHEHLRNVHVQQFTIGEVFHRDEDNEMALGVERLQGQPPRGYL